jgi:SAM-dependent methyltransferase
MLAVARRKDIYRSLHVADVGHVGLRGDYYDLCIQSLADEHMPDLRPLYREAARITKQDGQFVIVDFHPQILMARLPTHFDRAPGEPGTIRSYVHLLSDHVKAAPNAGWILQEMDERLVGGMAAQEAQMGGLFWPAGQLFNGLAALSFPNYE